MELEEFLKKNPPAKKKSAMAPFLAAMQTLENEGYTHEQIQAFLKKNGVEVSRQRIGTFLKSQAKKNEKSEGTTTTQKKSGLHNTKVESKPVLRNTKTKAVEPGEPVGEDTGSHRPEALDAIINSTPDLAALSKLGKGKRGKK